MSCFLGWKLRRRCWSASAPCRVRGKGRAHIARRPFECCASTSFATSPRAELSVALAPRPDDTSRHDCVATQRSVTLPTTTANPRVWWVSAVSIFANIFTNPDKDNPTRPLATKPDRFLRRLEVVTRRPHSNRNVCFVGSSHGQDCQPRGASLAVIRLANRSANSTVDGGRVGPIVCSRPADRAYGRKSF